MLTTVNNENPGIDTLKPIMLMVCWFIFYFPAKLLRTASMQHHQFLPLKEDCHLFTFSHVRFWR